MKLYELVEKEFTAVDYLMLQIANERLEKTVKELKEKIAKLEE
jgi:two-component SAPR family response regulator